MCLKVQFGRERKQCGIGKGTRGLGVAYPPVAARLLHGFNGDDKGTCHTVTMATYKSESFNIEQDLVGLVIGTDGSNIKKAEQLPGILSINVDGRGRCTIFSKTEEALKKAKEILDLRKELFTVPKQFAGKIIGRFGSNMNDIMSKSLVHRINVIDNKEVDEDVLLEIIGTLETIEKAKHMLNCQLSEFKHAIDDISDIPELKTETMLYKVNINRQDGTSLGISITTDEGTSRFDKSIVICGVTKDSQAERAGVRVGDKLISVNGISLAGAYQREVADLIKYCSKHISMVLSRKRVDHENENEFENNPDNPGHTSPDTDFASHQTFQQYRESALYRQTRGASGRRRRGSRRQ